MDSTQRSCILEATEALSIEIHIYWSGDIGWVFARALEERASGIEIEHYHPLRWYNLGRMNNRTHRKLLVVDGKTPRM
jgi:cardiolipin synthase